VQLRGTKAPTLSETACKIPIPALDQYFQNGMFKIRPNFGFFRLFLRRGIALHRSGGEHRRRLASLCGHDQLRGVIGEHRKA
jgi:hypothetical protein